MPTPNRRFTPLAAGGGGGDGAYVPANPEYWATEPELVPDTVVGALDALMLYARSVLQTQIDIEPRYRATAGIVLASGAAQDLLFDLGDQPTIVGNARPHRWLIIGAVLTRTAGLGENTAAVRVYPNADRVESADLPFDAPEFLRPAVLFGSPFSGVVLPQGVPCVGPMETGGSVVRRAIPYANEAGDGKVYARISNTGPDAATYAVSITAVAVP